MVFPQELITEAARDDESLAALLSREQMDVDTRVCVLEAIVLEQSRRIKFAEGVIREFQTTYRVGRTFFFLIGGAVTLTAAFFGIMDHLEHLRIFVRR